MRILKNEGAIALVFCFLTLTACFSQERAVLNRTVLSVNGHEVSAKEFADRLAIRLKSFDALYAKEESNLERAKEETVHAFLLEFIARDFAAKSSITIDKNDVDAEVASVRSKYPDEFAFRRAFADENLSIEKWRHDLEFSLLQKKIFATVTASAKAPTEAEMKAHFEANRPQFHQPAKVRLRQIVLEKEDDAKRIIEELSEGAKFAELARKFSIAPESANGGDTGWIEKGTLEVFDQAFKMKEGARSKILKSPYGWHIYEVVKKEPEARLSFEGAKAKIRAHLTELKAQKLFASWLEEQVRKSTVKRNDGLIRAIKVTTKGA